MNKPECYFIRTLPVGIKTKGVRNKLKMSYSVYILPFQKDNLNCHQQKHFLKVQITKLTSQAIWFQLQL